MPTDIPIPADVLEAARALINDLSVELEGGWIDEAVSRIARALIADRAAQAERMARLEEALKDGPVPVFECPFAIGQPVHLTDPYPECDPNTVYFVTGISWEYRFVAHRGWNITVAMQGEIQNGHGATDGFAPSDLRPARALSQEGSDA